MRAPIRGTTLDLRVVTRGFRLVSGLAGRSDYVWIDRWTGRLALRIKRARGTQATAAWPGPIWSNAAFGKPLLSWFATPVADASADAFVDALNVELEQTPSAGTAPEVAQLMRRVLAAQATGNRRPLPHCPEALLRPRQKIRVLLIDERASSKGLYAVATRNSPQAFDRMVSAARAAHSGAEFWLVRSADKGSGDWLSSFAHALPPGTSHVFGHYSPCAMLPHVDHVYTIGASEGMHALLAGVPVHVFGAPWYAGWGLTKDDRRFSDRTARPTLAALFDVVFLRFTQYLDPVTHTPGSLDTLLDTIELQQAVQHRFADLRRVAGTGFQWWKRPFATPFLGAGGGSLRWSRTPHSLKAGECAALWGARSDAGIPVHVPRVRMEDGFFHSTGLGSDMIAPRSQVIDRRGLYFDASQPSDLTVLLNETDFSAEELARAAALRDLVVRLGVTKYNLGRRRPLWGAPEGKQIVLVPGQVADDASIRLGTRSIATADALLRKVRERRPEAFIVYKPHPDVLSGNRQGLVNAHRLADVVDAEADLLSLVDAADEVHTLSSLAGFDALLRGKAVFTYGLPFYAGWGLTQDALAPIPWRQRTLSLDMLTAGALLRYPIYWDWRLRLYTTPEAVVTQLAPQASRPLRKVSGNYARPFLKAFRWTRNALMHALWRGGQWLQTRASTKQQPHG
ncbi:capsular polysaccharide biosynthesis protein [Paraburkholderia hospita]|uniref:capsular polysaccharide export protein, LipB/KpsS family n=1 Tax=Paraburkholderia hospita TaxID=169430 RepID=UPI0002718B1A|nr:capsular polysaccharide biosynthesis protein [Paraburkholderia hospita]EUC14739.1 Capsule polysaccharide biosynthesis protein [Burkholderia sp. BT03]SKC94007.1 Capsule polysaccharide export protein KpsC/LpsZ [Paraburkholderia hospita]